MRQYMLVTALVLVGLRRIGKAVPARSAPHLFPQDRLRLLLGKGFPSRGHRPAGPRPPGPGGAPEWTTWTRQAWSGCLRCAAGSMLRRMAGNPRPRGCASTRDGTCGTPSPVRPTPGRRHRHRSFRTARPGAMAWSPPVGLVRGSSHAATSACVSEREPGRRRRGAAAAADCPLVGPPEAAGPARTGTRPA
jgi:hypothetical protein